MKLYLLRHAEAVPHGIADAQRELTALGAEQARRIGAFGRKYELVPELLLSSPYRRAEQTARLFAEETGNEVILVDWLISGMEPETALQELHASPNMRSVMLVGHEPDFSRLAATLLGLPSSCQIHLRKGSLTLFTLDKWRAGTATLEFSLPPNLL